MIGPIPDRRTEIGTVVDEIGLEIGIYGDWRLKTILTPVFARSGPVLQAIGARGGARPFDDGREMDEATFRRAVAPRDRTAVSLMNAALCLRNLQQTFVDGLKLILDAELGAAATEPRLRAAMRALVGEVGRNGLERGSLFVDITHLADASERVLGEAAAALRSNGIGVAFRERGDGIALADSMPPLSPGLVVIDGDWFRVVARQPATAQLLGALVQGYRRQGALVLIEGVTTATELAIALEARADWLSGPLLSPPVLAGAVFPDQPLPIEMLLDERRVIPLFR